MRSSIFLAVFLIVALYVPFINAANYAAPTAAQKAALGKYTNIIVLVESATSFDYLFGDYEPAGPSPVPIQVNRQGVPYACLPNDNYGVLMPSSDITPCATDSSLAANGFPVTLNTIFPDTEVFQNDDYHGFFNIKYCAGNGANYVYWGGGGEGTDTSPHLKHYQGGLALGRYNLTGSYLYELASNYTLFTNYFASAYGGPFLNHQALIGTPKVLYNNSATVCHNALGSNGAPSDVVFPSFGTDGLLAQPKDDSTVGTTSNVVAEDQDCYVNTQIHTVNFGKVPHIAPITSPNIGDELTAAGISWTWYAEDFSLELNQTTGGGQFYSYYDQPFVYYDEFQDLSSVSFNEHNQDANTQFFAALQSNTLPNISWVKPDQSHDFGISDNSTENGIIRLQQYVEAIQATEGFQAGTTLLLVTWADGSNQFDHVAPYAGDNWGPGPRVPLIAIGASFAGGVINSNNYEHLSIVSMLETKAGLSRTQSQLLNTAALGTARSGSIADLTTAFA